VDIKSETEFSEVAEDIEIEGAEDADGRCAAVLSAGRRCPNAALPGSRYCGLPQHQALARFDTNQVTVLAALSEEEVAKLADPESDDAEIAPLVERAEVEFGGEQEVDEAEAEAEAEVAEAEEEVAEEELEEAEEEGEDADEIAEEALEAAEEAEEEPSAEVAEEEPSEDEPAEEEEVVEEEIVEEDAPDEEPEPAAASEKETAE
jgi:transcription termination/antitermination protein NusA